jgi:hypothetical protein
VKILVDVSNTMGSVLPVEYQRLPLKHLLGRSKEHNSRSVADVRSPRLRRGDRLQQHRMSASFNYLDPADRPELQPLMAKREQPRSII